MAHREPRETDALLDHTERGHKDFQPSSGWSHVRYKYREAFAEFLGTATLVIFGVGVIAQVVLSEGRNGDWLSINLAWGLGLASAIYVSGGISGGHLNPAVTLSMALFRQFSWVKVPIYWGAQFAGAFAGAATIYLTYYPAFENYDGGNRAITGANATAGIFATYPAPFVGTFTALFSEFIGTAMLVLVIMATSDKRNTPAGNVQPLAIGLGLTVIGASLGWETGFALNPARDLGPRIFTAIAGWGPKVFSASGWYFWIPTVAPLAGGVFGAFLYDLLIYTGPSPFN